MGLGVFRYVLYIYIYVGEACKTIRRTHVAERMRFYIRGGDSHGEELHFSGWPGGGGGDCCDECSWIVQDVSFSEGSVFVCWCLLPLCLLMDTLLCCLLGNTQFSFCVFFFSFFLFCFRRILMYS